MQVDTAGLDHLFACAAVGLEQVESNRDGTGKQLSGSLNRPDVGQADGTEEMMQPCLIHLHVISLVAHCSGTRALIQQLRS